MTLSEKTAYLKGLMEGMELPTDTKEGKLLTAIVDVLHDMAETVADLEDSAIAVSDELDEIEDTLDAMEDFLLDVDEDDDDYDDEDYEDVDEDDDYDFGDDEVIYEVTCPTCGETINIDEEMLEKGEIACPKCGESLEFELDPEDAEEIEF